MGRRHGRRGLSASRVRQSVYVVSAVCDYAVRTGRIARSPVVGVKLPRPSSHIERVFLDHDQVATLAAAARELYLDYGVSSGCSPTPASAGARPPRSGSGMWTCAGAGSMSAGRSPTSVAG
jgi:hypothetical protein